MLVWIAAAEVALASAFHFETAEFFVKLVRFDVVYAYLIFMTNGNWILLFGYLSRMCL